MADESIELTSVEVHDSATCIARSLECLTTSESLQNAAVELGSGSDVFGARALAHQGVITEVARAHVWAQLATALAIRERGSSEHSFSEAGH